ncbi:hypothetical protein DDR33_20130 [Pararcticibacter amylolyticus]|uniref:Peptidase S74 domain-containing protein n=2 Tax=Pararcticibacter amylolyticus TaxID=2173175 RepID=A0A2U2PC33_9SPHI|nr:hypothetical protein DDR33_20130 [Pararcticibacter amylolyticus]
MRSNVRLKIFQIVRLNSGCSLKIYFWQSLKRSFWSGEIELKKYMKRKSLIFIALLSAIAVQAQETLQTVTDRGASTSNGKELALNWPNGSGYTFLGGTSNGSYGRIGAWSPVNGYSDLAINEGGGRVGIATNNPTSVLYVNDYNPYISGFTVQSGNAGFHWKNHTLSLISTPSWDHVPYIEWIAPNGKRQAYQGWEQSFFSLTLENGYNYSINGGNVGIGTSTPDSKLTVAGKIHSQEVKVSIDAGADFVFHEAYNLRPLSEIEKFIAQNRHLPEIVPAKEMEKNGLELGTMNVKLLQKIEELTLYLIDVNKKLETVEKNNKQLMEEVEHLKNPLYSN